jgi:hydroxymethylglutaryl-CoA lyase
MCLLQRLRTVDVGPRDGPQNEKQIIPADLMTKLVNWQIDAGCTVIAVTSLGDGTQPPPARRHQLRAVTSMMGFAAALPTWPDRSSG